MNFLRVLNTKANGVFALLRNQNPVTGVLQNLARQAAHHRFVFDQQHGLRSRWDWAFHRSGPR